jgi:transposase
LSTPSTPTAAGRTVSRRPWRRDRVRPRRLGVERQRDRRGFAVIPRRWAVERTFAWITAHRRLARDYERHTAVAEAMIRWAAINTITRRLARGGPSTRQLRRAYKPSS